MIAAIGLLLGVLLGLWVPLYVSTQLSSYVAISILAALDSVFGGVNAYLNKRFDIKIFLSGFFGNSILAFALAYMGGLLNIDLTLAAIIVFGVRLFNNFGNIRHELFTKLATKKIKLKIK